MRVISWIEAPLEQATKQHNLDNLACPPDNRSTQPWRTSWESWLNTLKLVKFLDEEDPDCW
jgi:hypothetical protein